MPTRRLPNSAATRLKAMRTGKDRKDAIPAPLVIPYTAATAAKLDLFYPAYKLKVEAMELALQAQTNVSATVQDTRQMAEWLISDFFSALQSAIRRKLFNATVRAYYGLAVSDEKIPRIKTEADIVFWGDKAATGEAARIAAGGAAITFPSIAEVNTAVNNFKNPNQAQANAKEAYDAAQEAVEADKAEADKLILKMWNETETAFDDGDKPSMRRKAREWGVIYVPTPGETPSPDDYSIIGTITDAATGNPINEVVVAIENTPVVALTDAQGKYFIGVQPAGTCSLIIYKGGYQVKNVPDVTIAAGVITTYNATLDTEGPTGSVTALVKMAGVPVINAKISVEGIPGNDNTDAAGKVVINAVPEGNQTIRAEINNGSGMFQTLPVTVIANGNVDVQFNF